MSVVVGPDAPSDWPRVALAHLVRFRNGQDYKDVEDPDGAYTVIGSGGPFARANSYLYDGESVLFGRKGTVDRPRYESGRFWTVDTMYFTKISRGLHARFLYWWATTVPFGMLATNTALPSVTQSDLGSLRLPLPPISDQEQIAAFLDRETAKIDALLAKQDALDGAVREHLRGVQDGLVSLSEGGVRFKYLVDEVDFRAGAEWDRLPLLSVSIHWGVRRRDEVTDDLPRAEDLSNYKVVESGDIVVNRMRAFQGALGRSPIDGIVSPDYLVLRAAANVRSDWLAAAMRTPEFISEMAARVRGIGSAELGTVRTPRINADELGEIRLDVPTPPEQEARYVTRLSSESQAAVLLERIGSLTDALKERRAALITAAVTGKLDVTTYGKAG